MSYLMYWFVFSLLLGGVLKFMDNWNHLISMLLSLELVVLSIYLIMSCVFVITPNSYMNAIYFLVLAICESALGLALVALLSRTQGGEMTLNSMMLKW